MGKRPLIVCALALYGAGLLLLLQAGHDPRSAPPGPRPASSALPGPEHARLDPPPGTAGARGALQAPEARSAAPAPGAPATPLGSPLGSGWVRGVVTDSGGAPLRECCVNDRPFLFDGRFELQLPPGDAVLRVTASGFVAREVALGQARPQDLVVALQPARRVPVWVTAADTRQAVIPYRLEAKGSGFHAQRTVTDPGGMCMLDAPDAPLLVRVSADPQAGYVAWEGEDRLAGRVALERGVRVSGQLVRGDLSPLATGPGCLVTVIGARHAWAPQVVEPAPDGSFSLTGIAPDEAFAVLAVCPPLGRTSRQSVRWLTSGTDRVLVPVWPGGQIVLTDGPPVGPVSLEAGQLPPAVRPPPIVLDQEGSPTWTCSRLPPGTWTVRWQGRVVGTVELEPRGDEPALACVPWPGDPQEVRQAWEAWAAAQAPALPLASGEVAPVRSASAVAAAAPGGAVAPVGTVRPLGARLRGLPGRR